MMRNGYAGSILRVNLSSGEVKKEPLPDELVDNYIGGRGFVAKLLYDELAPFRATFCRPAAKPISAPNRRPPAGMRTAIWAAISARL
jgi:aldehyde:ferredoxin oxidoreductase